LKEQIISCRTSFYIGPRRHWCSTCPCFNSATVDKR